MDWYARISMCLARISEHNAASHRPAPTTRWLRWRNMVPYKAVIWQPGVFCGVIHGGRGGTTRFRKSTIMSLAYRVLIPTPASRIQPPFLIYQTEFLTRAYGYATNYCASCFRL